MADAGLKLGVDGEKDFKRALSEINDTMKTLGTEMKLVSSEFDANDKSVTALKSRYGVMSQEVDAQSKKVDTLKDALEAASKEFGENDKRTQNWQRQLNLATAELNKMDDELGDLKDELDDAKMPTARLGEAVEGLKEKFSDAVKWPKKIGSEISNLATPLKKGAGLVLDLGKNLASVAKTAASFTLNGVKTAITSVTAATTGLAAAAISAANNTAAAGDEIDKASQKAKMSREAYQEWSFVLSQNGADAAQLGSGMDALVNKIKDASKGSEETAALFKELGISMWDVQNKTPEEMFTRVINRLQDMDNETRKAVIANELLGGAGAELMPLLNSTAEATKALKNEAHDLGMIMSDDAVDAAVKYTDSVDKMKRSATNAFQSVAAELLPAFSLIVDGITGLTTEQEGANQKITSGLKALTRKIEKMLPMIADIVSEILPILVDSFMMVAIELIPDLVKSIQKIIVSIGGTLKDNFPKIKEAGAELINGLWNGFEGGAEWLAGKLRDWTSNLTSDFAENSRIFIKDGTVMIVEKIKEYIPKIIDVVIDIVPKLAKYLLEVLPTLLTSIVVIAGELVKSLVLALKENWPEIKQAGLDLVTGLWEGIKDAGTWLFTKLKGWASDIVGDVKEFFGIASPSKVFAGIGGYLAEGLGVGFDKEMDIVSKQMRDAVPTQFDTAIDAKIGVSGYSRFTAQERGLAQNGYRAQQTIVLQVGEREFGRIVVDASQKEYERRDIKVVAV